MNSKKSGFFDALPQNFPAEGNEPLPQIAAFETQQQVADLVSRCAPPRLMYANGAGAFGTFTVAKNLSEITKAKLFSAAGNTCKILVRFSDAERSSRHGFSAKFYTEEGIWDLVGQSSPVFYLKDPQKFPALLHAQLRQPDTNLFCATAAWDFYSMNPETLHALVLDHLPRETKTSYCELNGYGVHAFAMTNAENETFWTKYHWKPQQKADSVTSECLQQDLIDALRRGDYPKWTLYAQIMTEEQAAEYRWNPFDATKVWTHEDFPLIEIGEMTLDTLPQDYFSEVEQAAFRPSNVIPGLALSPDPILLGRLSAYTEAQRHRIGTHGKLLPVNRCPFNKGIHTPELIPNSAENSNNASLYGENEHDHFSQAGLFYSKVLNDEQREELAANIVAAMKQIEGARRGEIISRQLCHFFRADAGLGIRVATGLNFNIDANMLAHLPS